MSPLCTTTYGRSIVDLHVGPRTIRLWFVHRRVLHIKGEWCRCAPVGEEQRPLMLFKARRRYRSDPSWQRALGSWVKRVRRSLTVVREVAFTHSSVVPAH